MVKRSLPIYHKVINELDSNGQLKNQITIDADKWNNSWFPSYVKGAEIKEGIRVQFKVLKIDGANSFVSYIRFNALNQDIKQALSDMYNIVDEFYLKEGLKE